jgi:hypothetical protein
MKPGVALTLSLCVNVALAVAAVKVLQPRPPAMSAPPAETGDKTETVRVVTNLPPETTFVTNGFHWRVLASTNYDVFVANLRAVGCPERTIRDIVVGEVWAQYERARARGDYSAPFWLNGPRRAVAERARESELLRLRHELAGLLRRLFACEWSPEMDRDAFDENLLMCRVLLGDMPEEQFERAAGLLFRAEETKEDVEWRCRGVYLAEDYAELRRRRDELERELRGILSPAQFEEFRARLGLIESEMVGLFGGGSIKALKPAADELRRLSLAWTDLWPPGWKFFELEDADTPAQLKLRAQALDEITCAILGETRFAELKRLDNSDYRRIREFTEQNHLTLDTAHKLDEIRALLQEEVARLREDASLDTGVRTQRVENLSLNAAQEIQTLLGPKLFGDFLRQSGQWVTNVNRL